MASRLTSPITVSGRQALCSRAPSVLPLAPNRRSRGPVITQAQFSPYDSGVLGPHGFTKPVFQHPQLPWIESVEVLDARDAMETCRGLDGEARNSCYLLFGCDPQGVETYLTVVEGLENALQSEPEPLESCWRRPTDK